MERRQHQRTLSRIPCDLNSGRKSVAGFVQDISAGGLSVRCDIRAAEEDLFTVTLKVAPRPVVIRCMVWHTREVRRPATGEQFTQMGLVLSAPSAEFMELVGRVTQARQAGRTARPAPRPSTSPTPTASRAARNSAPAPPPDQFALRVQQEGGPRTRRLIVGGLNEKDAEEIALAEIGPGWSVLDVKRV